MKVLHICTNIAHGGAARATRNLHLGLRSIGVESTVLTRSGAREVPFSEDYSSSKNYALSLQAAAHFLINNNRTEEGSTHFTLDLFGCELTNHPLVFKC